MLLLALIFATQSWISVPAKPPTILEGNWQTCDGEERAYDHCIYGKCVWSLHLGPGDEFAIYEIAKDPSGDHQHSGADNLLMPFYKVRDEETRRGRRVWRVEKLDLEVEVIAGELVFNCEKYYVMVRNTSGK
jgi:hypothetical protein